MKALIIIMGFAGVILAALCIYLSVCLGRAKKQLAKARLDMASACHDICSPLTNIKGFADAMLSGVVKPDEYERSLAVISMESARISGLAKRMLVGAESAKRIFGVCDTLARMCIIFENSAKARGVSISTVLPEDEVYICAHFDGIVEALYNIINNAVKYCTDGGNVQLVAAVCGKTVEITVANDCSLTQNDAENLLKPGFRGQNSENTDGMGLGLYIADSIIRENGAVLNAKLEGTRLEMSFAPDIAE